VWHVHALSQLKRHPQRLSEGGKEVQCGWLKDKFGLSWQITPTVLIKLITDKDPIKSQRAMAAMMTMVKIDIAAIQEAYDC
jgi:predicted 3-demethylubiquinone-9 3-methyltransferase (glyoxalase superfamily)